jgi:Cu+-exporting ATPase
VGTAGNREIVIGTESFMSERRIERPSVGKRLSELRTTGQTAVLLAVDGCLAGIVAIADPIKATAKEAIAQLHAAGIRVVMLTGDNRLTAEAVAKQLSIDEVIAGVLPAEKREVVARLKRDGRKVAMAGDGINDAPALAEADVGIAMGTGTDIAIQSAGVTLVKGDLLRIAQAIELSRATSAAIRQNLVLAFLYNGLCVPLAAFGFVSPMWASAAMSASSLSVIGNSLRLRTSR